MVGAARLEGLHLLLVDQDTVGLSFSEVSTAATLRKVHAAFGVTPAQTEPLEALPAGLSRETPFLTHEVFSAHRSETQMLRYLRRLSARDYALDRGMIPLGSCTMKLNATTEMEPVSLPGFADLHPFAPAEDATGYAELVEQLEALAGRGHRLRPGLDPAQRRVAGRARRPARDPRLPPGQRRRCAATSA